MGRYSTYLAILGTFKQLMMLCLIFCSVELIAETPKEVCGDEKLNWVIVPWDYNTKIKTKNNKILKSNDRSSTKGNWLKLCYQFVPSLNQNKTGAPTVVVFQGGPGSKAINYLKIHETLTDHNVLYVDMRATHFNKSKGMSYPPTTAPRSIWVVADTIMALNHARKFNPHKYFDGSIIAYGSSYGTITATIFSHLVTANKINMNLTNVKEDGLLFDAIDELKSKFKLKSAMLLGTVSGQRVAAMSKDTYVKNWNKFLNKYEDKIIKEIVDNVLPEDGSKFTSAQPMSFLTSSTSSYVLPIKTSRGYSKEKMRELLTITAREFLNKIDIESAYFAKFEDLSLRSKDNLSKKAFGFSIYQWADSIFYYIAEGEIKWQQLAEKIEYAILDGINTPEDEITEISNKSLFYKGNAKLTLVNSGDSLPISIFCLERASEGNDFCKNRELYNFISKNINPYDSAKYQIFGAPIYYFVGSHDVQTIKQEALYHYMNQIHAKKHIMLFPELGHSALEFLRSSAGEFGKLCYREIFNITTHQQSFEYMKVESSANCSKSQIGWTLKVDQITLQDFIN